MRGCPGVSGANGFAADSNCGPAAMWIIPDMPLPAIKEGLADTTTISQGSERMF